MKAGESTVSAAEPVGIDIREGCHVWWNGNYGSI